MSFSSLGRRLLLLLVAFCISVIFLAPASRVSAKDKDRDDASVKEKEADEPDAAKDDQPEKKTAAEIRKEKRDASRKAEAERARKRVEQKKAREAERKEKKKKEAEERREKKLEQIEKSLGKKEKGYFLIKITTIRHQKLKTASNARPAYLPVVKYKLEVANGRRAAAEEIEKRMANIAKQKKPRGSPYPSPQRKCQLIKRYTAPRDADSAKAKGQVALNIKAKEINEKNLQKAKKANRKRIGGPGGGGPV